MRVNHDKRFPAGSYSRYLAFLLELFFSLPANAYTWCLKVGKCLVNACIILIDIAHTLLHVVHRVITHSNFREVVQTRMRFRYSDGAVMFCFSFHLGLIIHTRDRLKIKHFICLGGGAGVLQRVRGRAIPQRTWATCCFHCSLREFSLQFWGSVWTDALRPLLIMNDILFGVLL